MSGTSFSFTVEDYVAPFLRNRSPDAGESGVGKNALIEFDILDDAYGVDTDRLDAYVNGVQVFSGPSTFIAPYNGASSSITPTTVDGYAGYHVVLDNTGEFLPNSLFTIRVTAKDFADNLLDEAYAFRTATGFQSLVNDIYEITLLLTYAGPMTVNAEYFNAANYEFNNGMYARLVEVVDDQNVILWVENFHTNEEFDLSVSSNILDAYGSPIPDDFNSITVQPFQSTATISNFNGLIRSWRNNNVVLADSQRIYVAGIRGIDVYRKESSSNPARWGQILDEYGVDSMFVANFPSDLIISDGDTPFLENQTPAPLSSVSSAAVIAFTVSDVTTAVEPTAVTVYINGTIAFSGGFGGWANGYSGTVIVNHKELEFSIIPPVSFAVGSVVIVRVVAIDLLNNRLDTTYQFSITPAALTGGWGGGAWGEAPWGS